MKNIFISLFSAVVLIQMIGVAAFADANTSPKNVVTLEIPTANPQKAEIKCVNKTIAETSLPAKILSEQKTLNDSKTQTGTKKQESDISKKAEKLEKDIKTTTSEIKDTVKEKEVVVKSEEEKLSVKSENAVKNVKTETDKGVKDTKTVVEKTSDTARNVAESARNTTSAAAVKTKEVARKTVDVSKDVADKTAGATKKAARNTVNGTRDFIDTVNPTKPVTKESLDASATVKNLKNEKKEINNAFKSRIKDVDAKIKSAENNSSVSDVQKRNLIYELNKEKNKLESEKESYNADYDKKIDIARENKRGKN